MSQKKRKKRHSQGPSEARNRQLQDQMNNEYLRNNEKRLNPTARNLLLGDLVLLAAVGLLVNHNLISQLLSNILSLVGIVIMMAALWFQFGKKRRDGGRGSWPGLD